MSYISVKKEIKILLMKLKTRYWDMTENNIINTVTITPGGSKEFVKTQTEDRITKIIIFSRHHPWL